MLVSKSAVSADCVVSRAVSQLFTCDDFCIELAYRSLNFTCDSSRSDFEVHGMLKSKK